MGGFKGVTHQEHKGDDDVVYLLWVKESLFLKLIKLAYMDLYGLLLL